MTETQDRIVLKFVFRGVAKHTGSSKANAHLPFEGNAISRAIAFSNQFSQSFQGTLTDIEGGEPRSWSIVPDECALWMAVPLNGQTEDQVLAHVRSVAGDFDKTHPLFDRNNKSLDYEKLEEQYATQVEIYREP